MRRTSRRLLVTHQNFDRWVYLRSSHSKRDGATVEFEEPSTTNDLASIYSMQVIFRDDHQIKLFLAADSKALAPMQRYVKLMRAIPSQAMVMTLSEFADEERTTLPVHYSGDVRVFRALTGHRPDPLKQFGMTQTLGRCSKGDEDVALSIAKAVFGSAELTQEAQSAVASGLRYLSRRSEHRAVRTPQSLASRSMHTARMVDEGVGWVLAEPGATEIYAFADPTTNEVQYRVAKNDLRGGKVIREAHFPIVELEWTEECPTPIKQWKPLQPQLAPLDVQSASSN